MSDSEQTQEPESKVPSPTEFFLKTSLYASFPLKNEEDHERAARIINLKYNDTMDGYCLRCKDQTVFRNSAISLGTKKWPRDKQAGVFDISIECARARHLIRFIIMVWDNGFCKIGQYPSLADIAIGEMGRYAKLLDGSQASEFTRAIGLYAHGVGIGSYVYLRRIFEGLIKQAKETAIASGEKIDEQFETARMDDKIGMLEHHLPEVLVENKSIYGVLSSGMHELSEEECLRYFPVIKNGIVMILEEALERKRKEELRDKLRSDIGKITGEVRTKRSGGT